MAFEREGKTYRLQAAKLKRGGLWFVFRDKTSGRTTHGAPASSGRCSKGDVVILDFNKAMNLPCPISPMRHARWPRAEPAGPGGRGRRAKYESIDRRR